MSRSTATPFRLNPDLQSLPADAVRCNGPLLRNPAYWICPNGDFYHKNETTGRLMKLTHTGPNKQYCAFASVKRKLPDGSFKHMKPIAGILQQSTNNRVVVRALVAYYFVKKIKALEGMRADFIDTSNPIISPENLHWVSADQQNKRRMAELQAKTQQHQRVVARATPDDPLSGVEAGSSVSRTIVDISDDVLAEQYVPYLDYFVRKDGREVVRKNADGTFRSIFILISHGYRCMMIHCDGESMRIRMNRLQMLARGIDIEGMVIDHIDGNPANDDISNLEVVDMAENTRRGQSAKPTIRVDPNTGEVLDNIRCVQEWVDQQGDDWNARTLYQHINSGVIYHGSLWYAGHIADAITGGGTAPINRDRALLIVRQRIKNLLDLNEITEEMVPSGHPPTAAMISILDRLDPRGRGDVERALDTTRCAHNSIHDRSGFGCCYVLSYHGSGDNGQLVICLQTLLVFVCSRDNLMNRAKSCPLCTSSHVPGAARMKIDANDPINSIPFYRFNPARQTARNPLPNQFLREYLQVSDLGISSLLPLRKSLFGIPTGNTGNRSKCDGSVFSYCRPVDDMLGDLNIDWILARRLACARAIAVRDFCAGK